MKRVVLYILTNLAVMVVLSVILTITWANRYLAAGGLNPAGLLVFSAIVGFTGSIFGHNGPRARSQQVAFFVEVPHPGTRPNDFPRRALARLQPRVSQVLWAEPPAWIRGH